MESIEGVPTLVARTCGRDITPVVRMEFGVESDAGLEAFG
jgi:hypothetical protein